MWHYYHRPFACPGSKNSIVSRSAATVYKQHYEGQKLLCFELRLLARLAVRNIRRIRSNGEPLGFYSSVPWHHLLHLAGQSAKTTPSKSVYLIGVRPRRAHSSLTTPPT